VQPVLERLPGRPTGSQTTERSAPDVSKAIINMLHSTKSPPESNRRRKKRIDVASGRSISSSDTHEAARSNVGKESPIGPQRVSFKPEEVVQQQSIEQDISGPIELSTKRKTNNAKRNVSLKRARKGRHPAAAAALYATRSSDSDSDISIVYNDSSDTASEFYEEESSDKNCKNDFGIDDLYVFTLFSFGFLLLLMCQSAARYFVILRYF